MAFDLKCPVPEAFPGSHAGSGMLKRLLAVVVFFALLGGIGAFGMVGLLVGPLAVAMLLTLLRMYRRDYVRAA